ncbi:MAG TPA: hypothetical protein VEV83_11465 [Parafilimonas sp.]|nr:hypothetical protein [Parafilimonas sp.]
MRSSVIVIFILPFLLFLSCSANTQKIYYSKTEGNFLFTYSHTIGQVKDHIIIWKYQSEKSERSEVIIYDDKMNVLNRVKTDILNVNHISSIDFINLGQSFAVVYQYSTKTKWFCKIASFDENGNCVKRQTIDSSSLAGAQYGNNPYKIIVSPNSKRFVLARISVPRADLVSLDFQLLDYVATRIQRSSILLPRHEVNLNEAILDTTSHLLVPMLKSVERNSIIIYKIDLTTDSLASVACEIKNGSLASNTIGIGQRAGEYIVNAQWKSGAGDKATNESGLFFWRFGINLSHIADTIFKGIQLPREFFNDEIYFKSSVIADDDGFYIISAPSYMASLSNYITKRAATNSDSMFFYGNAAAMPTPDGVAIPNNLDPADKVPVLRPESRSHMRGNTVVVENFHFINAAHLRLHVIKIDNANKLVWTKYLDGANEKTLTRFVNLSHIIKSKGTFSLLYAVSGEKGKEILEKTEFLPDGNYSSSLVFSMKLNYSLIFQKGVEINSSVIVFPCMIHNKLAFARVEME